MKRIRFLFLLVCLSMVMHSCFLFDFGHREDSIHISPTTAEFSSAGDSVMITTEGTEWRISSVSVDGVYYYDFRGIDPFAYHYTIKEACFVLERRDKHTLIIKVDANPTNVKRIIIVTLEDAEYHGLITITQN